MDDAPRRQALLAILDNSLREQVTALAALPREQAVDRTLTLVYGHAEAWRILGAADPRPDELRRLADGLDNELVAGELRAVAERVEAGR